MKNDSVRHNMTQIASVLAFVFSNVLILQSEGGGAIRKTKLQCVSMGCRLCQNSLLTDIQKTLWGFMKVVDIYVNVPFVSKLKFLWHLVSWQEFMEFVMGITKIPSQWMHLQCDLLNPPQMNLFYWTFVTKFEKTLHMGSARDSCNAHFQQLRLKFVKVQILSYMC